MRHFAWLMLALGLSTLAGCSRLTQPHSQSMSMQVEWADVLSADLALFAQSIHHPNPAPALFDPADGVLLEEAELIALFYNVDLRLARAELQITQSEAKHAGTLADPELNINLLRVLDAAGSPWIVGTDALFTIPLLGQKGFEERQAGQRALAQAWRVAGREVELLHQLRSSWAQWSALRAKLAVNEDQVARMQSVQRVTQRLSDADAIRRAEGRLFEIENVVLQIDLHHYTHEAQRQELELRALMGVSPSAALALQPGSLSEDMKPQSIAEVGTESVTLAEQHPTIRALQADLDAAQLQLSIEKRAAWSPFQAGPAYERDEGSDKLGGNLRVTLPLWNRNRSGIAQAEARVAAARAALQAALSKWQHATVQAEQKLESAQTDMALQSDQLAPLVDRQIEEAQQLAELGDLQPMLLLEAMKRAYETKLGIVDSWLETEQAAAELLSLTSFETIPAMEKAEQP